MEKTPFRILMLDDDREDYLIVKSLLTNLPHRNYEMDWASTIEEGMVALETKIYDAFLVDYRLGVEEGTEFIRLAAERGCRQPFILLTGMDDPDVDAHAQKSGASDYIVKSNLRARDLDRSIRYASTTTENMHKIKQLNGSLELIIEERTHKLHEALRRLQEQVTLTEEANRKLEALLEKEKELNDLKSRFVSMASHEFRTPLTTVKSSASLILSYLDRQDFANVRKHVGRIQSVVANLNNILSDFLSLGKLEDGRFEVKLQDFDLPDFLRETIGEVQHLLKPGQRFDYEHEGENKVHLDESLLKNVLLNLLSNAIKYSPEETCISVSSKIGKGHSVEIRVSDRGIGISPSDQEQLFGRFFRASNVGNIPGTGLGLFIVRRHVEMMGGQIGCESTLGEGSTFWVRFED